jgi:hypothetical protein
VKHYVITRWNVRGFGDSYRDTRWLAERRRLFERFCLPSVQRQTVGDFSWLVLIDTETSPQVRTWLRGCDPRIQLVSVGPGPVDRERAIRAVIRSCPEDWVMTTRLDSDDAIECNHLRAVRAHSHGTRPFVGFEYGLSFNSRTGELRWRSYRLNPFLSLIEPREGAMSVHIKRHDHVRSDELVSLGSIGWLQVSHGGNLGNTLQGWPVPEAEVRSLLEAFGVSG